MTAFQNLQAAGYLPIFQTVQARLNEALDTLYSERAVRRCDAYCVFWNAKQEQEACFTVLARQSYSEDLLAALVSVFDGLAIKDFHVSRLLHGPAMTDPKALHGVESCCDLDITVPLSNLLKAFSETDVT